MNCGGYKDKMNQDIMQILSLSQLVRPEAFWPKWERMFSSWISNFLVNQTCMIINTACYQYQVYLIAQPNNFINTSFRYFCFFISFYSFCQSPYLHLFLFPKSLFSLLLLSAPNALFYQHFHTNTHHLLPLSFNNLFLLIS